MYKTIFKATLLSCISSVAFASIDLTVTNKTTADSTCIINNGACSSTILGEQGITRAGATNIISGKVTGVACMFNSENCQADVYMSADCSGPKVGTIIFSTTKGITSITTNASYSITSNSPFTIVLAMVGGAK